MIALPPRARILVVALRRLGDVLLTTPLIRSLKQAFPDAAIDALVFAGTEGILAGNPDLAGVIAMPPRNPGAGLALARTLWRRYDLAVSTQSGDRPTLFAWIAGRASGGPVAPRGAMAWLKRSALNYPVVADDSRHRVEEVLRLARALGIPAVSELVCPAGAPRAGLAPEGDYAVIHAGPMFRYKRWTAAGWRAVAAALAERGLAVLATGGPGREDRRYLDEVWARSSPPVRRLDGMLTDGVLTDGILTWAELAGLIRAAKVYVGPDTSVTHLAAATGAMTVALYGPTDPRRWGPWPVGRAGGAWQASGTIQRRGNVWLVQNPQPCLPCQNEGCDRKIESHSRCLDELSPLQVLAAVDQALASARAAH
ncbi:MAG TPA: glycosyltransferase family 9 protein [Xanthobacteraceae bacterium]|jgi:heptosyltransferase-3